MHDTGVKDEAILNLQRITPPLSVPSHIYRKKLVNELKTPSPEVTFIYGPPGFGKTVLACQLHNSDPKNSIWFTVHSLDTAKEVVLYLVAAFRKKLPNFGKWVESLPGEEVIKISTVAKLCKEIGGSKRHFKFIMDDSDLFNLENIEIAQAFMKYRPENVTLYFIRRKTPSQSTFNFLNGIPLRIITPNELKLDLAELSGTSGELSDTEILKIIELTDGWPAGYAILSNEKNIKNIKIKSEKMSIENQYALAVQQTIGIFEEAEITFINNLIWFDDFTPEMAKAVSKNKDSDRILFNLTTDSNFVTRIQNDPLSFRLNQLVQQSLFVSKTPKELLFSLTQAFIALIENNFTSEAFRILAELGDDQKVYETLNNPEVIKVISRVMREAIHGGNIEILDKWNRVSRSSKDDNPIARKFLDTYIAYVKSDLIEMKIRLQELEKLVIEFGLEQKMSIDISIFRSFLFFSTGKLESCFAEIFNKSNNGIYESNFGNGSRLSFLRIVTWAAIMQDDSSKLKKIMKIIDNKSHESLDARDQMVLEAIRLLIASYFGMIFEASDLLELLENKESEILFGGVFTLFETKYVRAMKLVELGEKSEAVKLLISASDSALKHKQLPWVVMFNGKIVEIMASEGRLKEAFALILETRDLIDKERLGPEIHSILDRFELIIRYSLDDNERIDTLINRLPKTFISREVRAGTYLKQGSSKTEAILNEFDRSIPKEFISYSMHMGMHYMNRPPIAKEHFWHALELGSSMGYFNYFLTFPPEVSQVFISIASEKPTVFLERLARELGSRMSNQIINSGGGSNLTKREADILRHLSTGLPIKTIAGNLNISRNTIKTHLRNLYRKLEVAGRREAVEKGRELLKV